MKTTKLILGSLALLLPALAQTQIAEQGRAQIGEILRIKATMSPEQRKMDSALAWASLKAEGKLPEWLGNLVTDPGTGPVQVDIRANVSDSLVQLINDVGGTVDDFSVGYNTIRATVPAYEIGRISQSADVKQISQKALATTNSIRLNEISPVLRVQDPMLVKRDFRLATRTQSQRWNRDLPLLASNGFIPAVFTWFANEVMRAAIGTLTSQGYPTHRANTVVNNMGYNGAGVKVGVLSDSASSTRINALIASGDLPANTVVLAGQNGTGSDEGTAMMEIVADMAPGAQLYFATAFSGVASFAANIIALKDAGCTVIVDDISYFNEGVYQDGPIAQAVNIVTDAGVTYISSAGNSGNKTRGTSGTWEGDFVSGGTVTSGPVFTFEGTPVQVHNFGGQNFNRLTAVSSNTTMLKWSDPLGGATNDYDLLILNGAGTAVRRFGAAFQNGTQDPVELSTSGNALAVNDLVVVVLFSGSPRALHYAANRGRLQINTPGAVYGHNGGANTVSAAAVFWNAARRGTVPFTAGSAYPVETFSSDGPRRIFYRPNGAPITAGNVLIGTNGGQVLQKPDLTAADGVTTMTPGFSPFYGTSAAAPHIAGIAALVKQVRPDYTPARVKAALRSGALDIMSAGVDRDAGHGITMATSAVNYAINNP